MPRLTQRQRRWATAIALLAIASMATYVALGILGVLRARGVSLPALPPPRPGDRVLVIAPHEDDETLGCGGYMQAAVAAGADVYVCLMTAGEGEELGAAWASHHPPLPPRDFVRLGQIRERESTRALTSIGVPPDHIIFLNYPNGGLSSMWTARYFSRANPWTSHYTRTTRSPFAGGLTPGAPFCGAALLADLETVIRRVQPTVAFTPHPGDVHGDHWATHCFTRLAFAELKARRAVSPQLTLYGYLVHRRGWPVPWGYYPNLPLTPPPALADLPLNRWLTFPLSPGQISQKNRMIAHYRSQAPAFDFLLRAFARRNEIFAQLRDVPMRETNADNPALLQEPTRETESLRRHRDADLVRVDFCRRGPTIQIGFETAAAPTQRTLVLVNLIVVDPAPGRERGLLVQYQPDQPLRTWLTTDTTTVRSPVTSPVTAKQHGNQVVLSLPSAYAGAGHAVILDVLTKWHGRVADHALTRLFETHGPAGRTTGNGDRDRVGAPGAVNPSPG